MESQELQFKNYKEPLKAVEKDSGYGYYGTLAVTSDGSKLQCHLCGGLFAGLGMHIRQVHGLSNREYKEKFQLAYLTVLVSDTERERLKNLTLEYFARMTPDQKLEHLRRRAIGLEKYLQSEEFRIKNKNQPKGTLETKNKRGTCPDQLIDKVRKVAEKLGHTPSQHEFVMECGSQKYKHLIYTTFGSWSAALRIAKLAPKQQIQTGGYRRYSDEELLEYLEIFAREERKLPTFTDFKQSFLPTYDVYIRRFGTIENARRKAGVYEILGL